MSTASYNIIETYACHCNVVSYLRVVVKVIWISFLLCPIGECCIVIMCLYIYPQAYRRNYMPSLNQIFVLLLMATIGPLLVVLRYVLPFLWMISYLHIVVHMLILLQLQATVYWSNTFVSTRWLFFAVASILSLIAFVYFALMSLPVPAHPGKGLWIVVCVHLFTLWVDGTHLCWKWHEIWVMNCFVCKSLLIDRGSILHDSGQIGLLYTYC